MPAREPAKIRDFIETATYAQGVKAAIPRLTVTGAEPGPRAVFIAAQHGRELNGIAAIERVFRQLDPTVLRGELVCLPIMNPLGVRMGRQDYPSEEARYRRTTAPAYNINREWLDADLATYAGTVARAAWETCVKGADLLVDLHGWSGLSLSWVWGSRRDQEWVRAFGHPWHMLHEGRGSATAGMSEVAAYRAGIPVVIAELAPQNVVVPAAVAAGERGLINLLKHLGCLDGDLDLPATQYEFSADHTEQTILAPAECLVVPERRIGEIVAAGDPVLRLLSLDTLETIELVTADERALVYNLGGMNWGEDIRDRAVIYPGQRAGILKLLRDCTIVDNP